MITPITVTAAAASSGAAIDEVRPICRRERSVRMMYFISRDAWIHCGGVRSRRGRPGWPGSRREAGGSRWNCVHALVSFLTRGGQHTLSLPRPRPSVIRGGALSSFQRPIQGRLAGYLNTPRLGDLRVPLPHVPPSARCGGGGQGASLRRLPTTRAAGSVPVIFLNVLIACAARSRSRSGREDWGLFTIEGVAAGVGWWLSRRRGLRMMEVPTPAIRKTSTCLTLPSPALT